MASSSTVWSCATLKDGVNLMDLELEEQELVKKLEALEIEMQSEEPAETQPTQVEVQPPESVTSMDTVPATPEELAAAGHAVLSPQADANVSGMDSKSDGAAGKAPLTVATPVRNEKPVAVEVEKNKPQMKSADSVESTLENGSPTGEVSTKPPAEEEGQVAADAKAEMSRKAKLRNAAKSRLNRWVKPHTRNPSANAPEWMIKEWKDGCKASIADLLSHCNFDKEQFLNKLYITVKKQQKIELTLDQGWYSEAELVELGWKKSRIDGAKSKCTALGESHCRKNQYDGEEEFFVTIRETAKRTESTSYDETHTQEKEATGDPTCDMGGQKFTMLAANQSRIENAAKCQHQPDQQQSKFGQTRDTFKKFMDSMISKTGKLRSLARELELKYDDSAATSCVTSLRTQIARIDAAFDKCNNVWCNGEAEGYFNEKFHSAAETLMKECTFVCSAASGVEMKIRNAKKYYNKRKATETSEANPDEKPKVSDADGSQEPQPKAKAKADAKSTARKSKPKK